MMVEKLVEPIMADIGLFFEAEAFYNRGEIVFTNYKNMDVTIDPLGMMGQVQCSGDSTPRSRR
jgi:hypothetical protein